MKKPLVAIGIHLTLPALVHIGWPFFKGIARLIATQTLEVLSSVQYQKESNSEQWVGGSLSHIFAYPVSASKLELTRQNLKSD